MSAVLSPDRVGRITGSRIGPIIGESPYATGADVLREMIRQVCDAEPEITGWRRAMDWGNEHEPDAIFAYEVQSLFTVTDHGDAQRFHKHPVHDFLGVTPDGLLYDGQRLVGAVEAKCPYTATYTTLAEVPWYEAQCRLVAECVGVSWVDLVIWRPGGIAEPIRIVHDPDWLPSILPTLQAFMTEFHETLKDPVLLGPYLAPSVEVVTHPEVLERTNRIAERAFIRDALDRADAEDREWLRPWMKARNIKKFRAGIVQGWTGSRKGSVDYRKAVADNAPDIDLEKYRGDGKDDVVTLKVTR